MEKRGLSTTEMALIGGITVLSFGIFLNVVYPAFWGDYITPLFEGNHTENQMTTNCTLNSAYWAKNQQTIIIAQEGNEVLLIVDGTNCEGEIAKFKIKDHPDFPLGSETFRDGKAIIPWTTQTSGDEETSEYIFEATLEQSSLTIDSPTLKLYSLTEISCNDGKDNDGDGWIDFLEDPGCTNSTDDDENNLPTQYQCSDNLDNDGDGLIDGNDPDCVDWQDNNETSDLNLDDNNNLNQTWPPKSSPDTKTWAYSWSNWGNKDNIVFMEQITNIKNPSINSILTALNSMPEGHKVILPREQSYAYEGFDGDPSRIALTRNIEDACKDSNGDFVTSFDNIKGEDVRFICPWWDNGIQETQQAFSNFLSALKSAGGEVDLMILDTESELSNWAFENTYPYDIYGPPLSNSLLGQHWQALENDPRFQSSGLKNELTTKGYVPQDSHLKDTIWQWGSNSLNSPESDDNYLIWNSIMHEKVAEYENDAIYDTARNYYPNLILSDYNFHYWDSQYAFPSKSGHDVYKYGNGAHVGNRQSLQFYAQLKQGIWNKDNDQGYFDPEPFNAFRYEVNKARLMHLSNPSIKVQPWVAAKNWVGPAETEYLIKGSDLYQEMIFHIILNTDTNEILFWNYGSTSESADYTILSNTMKEIDTVTGYTGRQPLTSTLTSWTQDFVYSGVQINDIKVWRFTPELDTGETINSIISSTSNEQVVLNSKGFLITFQNATIYTPASPVSQQGLWIIQRASAPNPTIG